MGLFYHTPRIAKVKYFTKSQHVGSVKVVEEFKHLPPEVAMERLRTLAVKMDKNLDEKIDKTELKVCRHNCEKCYLKRCESNANNIEMFLFVLHIGMDLPFVHIAI